MQAMNGLDQLQPVDGMGPVGEIRLVPDLETFRVLPYAPRTGAMLVDHVHARRRAGAAVPALVPEADGGAPRRARRRAARGRVRERVRARGSREDGGYVPVDASLCFSTIGMTASQDVRRRARRRARAAGHRARAVLRRARPRPAGDLDRARAGAAGGGRADPRARDDPRRRRAARARRVARAEAVAGRRGQRRPHPLLALGQASATASTTRPPTDLLSRRGARVPRRRARAPARRCAG